jgi:hypothetical protein
LTEEATEKCPTNGAEDFKMPVESAIRDPKMEMV